MESVTNNFKYKDEVRCHSPNSKFSCEGQVICICPSNWVLVAIERPNSVTNNELDVYRGEVPIEDYERITTDFPDEKYGFWAFDMRRVEFVNELKRILIRLEDDVRS